MKLPAFEATNEAKSWSFLPFSPSDLDLKQTLNTGLSRSKNAGNEKFRHSCGLLNHKTFTNVNLGVLVTPSKTFLQKLISADIS